MTCLPHVFGTCRCAYHDVKVANKRFRKAALPMHQHHQGDTATGQELNDVAGIGASQTRKSPWITWRRFSVIFVVSLVMAILATIFTVYWIVRSVPSPSQVDSVTFASLSALPFDYDNAEQSDGIPRFTTNNPRTIANVIAVQQEITDWKSTPRYFSLFRESNPTGEDADVESEIENQTTSFNLSYSMKGNQLSHSHAYDLYPKYLHRSRAFRKLINDPGYREAISVGHVLGYDNVKVAEVCSDGIYAQNQYSLDDTEAQQFARVVDEDYLHIPKQSIASDGYIVNADKSVEKNIFPIAISASSLKDKDDIVGNGNTIFIQITSRYTRTIAWLKSHNLYDKWTEAAKHL